MEGHNISVYKVHVKNVERNAKIKKAKFNEILLYYSLLY